MNRSVLRGAVLITLAVAAIAALILIPGKEPKAKPHPPNNNPWVLVNYDPATEFGTYLGNGYIATRIKGDGVGDQCFMAGFYDDEKITPTPNWSNLRFYDGKTRFQIDKDANYKQTLDLKTGILTTEATWRAGRKALTGRVQVVVLRTQQDAGMIIAELTPSFSGKLRLHVDLGKDIWDANDRLWWNSSATTNADVWGTKKSGLHVGLAGVLATDNGQKSSTAISTREQDIDITEDKPTRVYLWNTLASGSDEAAVLTRVYTNLLSFLGVNAQLGHFTDAENVLYKTNISAEDVRRSVGKQLAAHKAAMAKLWEHDIIIDGPVKDQQALRACKFYLLQSVREGSQWSIPPMGLSSDGYLGHIFWDADIWMFPALVLQHPELARSIVDYRYNTLQGAFENAKADGFQGAQYAWESATTGREVTPKDLVYRHERHINGDVALAQWQYFLATADTNWLKTRGYPVLQGTADWWVSKATLVKDKNRYEIHNVVPPDENADLVDNSAYTNAIAKLNLDIAIQAAKLTGNRPNPTWAEVSAKLYIPYDAVNKRFIARDNYDGAVAKQADTELLAYPLQVELPGVDMSTVYKNTLNYYGPKVHKNGPAMISSAFSVIAARTGDRERAYNEFVRSYEPYFRQPFLLFNEKASRTFDNTCFLTGAAGPIKAAVFGLAGASVDYFPAGASEAELTFKPSLPAAWKSVKITGIQWRGKSFDVTVTHGDKVTVVPRASGG